MSERGPDPALHGSVRQPRTDSPTVRPNSVRRIAWLDMDRPDGTGGTLALHGRAWDFEVDAYRQPSVRETVALRAAVDYHRGRTLTDIETSPVVPELASLVGHSAIAGLRGRVAEWPSESPRRWSCCWTTFRWAR